jgi:hypothetical protein
VPVGDKEATESVSGLSIMEDGRVFVTRDANGHSPELFLLDRSAGAWNSVSLPPGGAPASTNWLLGGGGWTLVFKTAQGDNLLRRFEMGPL